MENPSKMETNELPDHQAKENADRIYPEMTKEGQQQNTAFQNGFIYGYRLALQSKEEELNRLKEQVLQTSSDWLKSSQEKDEQLKAKDEELAVQTKEIDDLRKGYTNDQMRKQRDQIDSLTSENERLREALIKVQSLLSQSTDKQRCVSKTCGDHTDHNVGEGRCESKSTDKP